MSLPKGFKRLEYIQSSGAQYVDSGFVPNQDTRIEMDVVPLSIAEAGDSTGFIPYGAATAYNSNAFECYTTASKLSFNYDGQYSVNGTIAVGTEIHISHNKNAVLVAADGTPVVEKTFTYQAFTAPYSLTVCATHRASMLCGNQKVKTCQIYDNGTLIRDFIPCQNASGAVGLWDAVNEEFYRNAGMGEFIAGPKASKSPNAPSTFQLDSVNDTSIVVSWQAVADVLGYKLWLNGSLIADTTETTVTVTVEPFTCMILSLVAYNENGNSPVVTLTHQYAPDNPILWLVTDRTAQDVALGNTKGTYNASDLNRVGCAVAYLADQLASCGVKITVHPKTDWVTTDIPSEQVLVTYLQNVRTLRTALTLVASVPEVPQDMQFFTHTEANSIEMLLVMLDTHITNMLSNVDTSWAVGSTYTGLYAKEAYR